MHVGLTLLNCLWEQEIVLAVKRGKKLVSNVAILCTITANQKLGMERSNRAVKVGIRNKKGNRIRRYGCRNVTRFCVFQDRILKPSG